jgi:hypothetical protein
VTFLIVQRRDGDNEWGGPTVRTGIAKPAVSCCLRSQRHHEGGSKGEPHVVCTSDRCLVVLSIDELETRGVIKVMRVMRRGGVMGKG